VDACGRLHDYDRVNACGRVNGCGRLHDYDRDDDVHHPFSCDHVYISFSLLSVVYDLSVHGHNQNDFRHAHAHGRTQDRSD
jgi:hypothetical protein